MLPLSLERLVLKANSLDASMVNVSPSNGNAEESLIWRVDYIVSGRSVGKEQVHRNDVDAFVLDLKHKNFDGTTQLICDSIVTITLSRQMSHAVIDLEIGIRISQNQFEEWCDTINDLVAQQRLRGRLLRDLRTLWASNRIAPNFALDDWVEKRTIEIRREFGEHED